MAAAARYHALRGLATMVVVALIAFGAWQYHGRFKASELRDQLFRAEIDKVPVIIDDMAHYRRWIDPLLRQDMAGAVTLAVGENNANTTFSGSIGGHGTLVKEGTGTLTLTGSNSFTGGLLLDGDGPVKEYADDAMRSGAKAAKKHVDEDRWLRPVCACWRATKTRSPTFPTA